MRGPASRFNDGTLEIVTALARLLAILGVLAALVSMFAYVWTGDGRWLATLGGAVAWGGAFGWIGFGTLGNAEWTEKPRA